MQDVSRALGEDKVFPAPYIISSDNAAGQCSRNVAIAHMHLPQRPDPKVLDIPSTSPVVFHAYDVGLDAESDWCISEIRPLGDINICSKLRAGFTDVCHRYVEH